MVEPLKMETIVVWFSCGAASAVAAKLTVHKYGSDHTVRIVNHPIAEEDPDNRRFLEDVSKWIGQPIEIFASTDYPSCSAEEVWKRRKFMASRLGAPCTSHLKRFPGQEWERINKPDWVVMGFTAEESDRHERFILTERGNVMPILINAKLYKKDCFRIIQEAGIELPRMYQMGYPNANCIGCVKVTSPTYWNHVRRQHPEIFERRSKLSRELGCKLARVKGERVYLDELPENAVGNSMHSVSFECGIYCEERK